MAAESALTKPGFVPDCRPCLITPGAGTGSWAMTFDVHEADGERTIRSIRGQKAGSPEFVLPVSEMVPVPRDGRFFFGPQDINFDSFQDLVLMVEQGAANASALYWLFDPQKSTYVPLGKYPMLQLDPAGKRLKTFERGGYGGRVYERNEYEFRGSKLLLVRSEKQDVLKQPNRFRRTVSERVGGRMQVVKRQIVSGAEPIVP